MPKNEVEALLFSAGKNMNVDSIANLVGADRREVIKDLKALQQEYNGRDSALMIVDEGEEWKIHVREKYLPLVQKIVADTELPKTVLETLAVVAYKSPVLQSEVINIRTSTAYEHIGLLIDMGFVTREKSGRSFLLRVTDKFFDYFDIAGDKTMQEIFKNVKKRAPPKAEEEKEDEQATLMDIPKVEIVDEMPEEKKEDAREEDPLVKKGKGKVIDFDDDGTSDPDRGKVDGTEKKGSKPDAKPEPDAEKAEQKREKPDLKKIEEEEHDIDQVLEKVESDIEEITTKRKKFQDAVKKKLSN